MADTKISIVEDDRGVGALLKCILSREGLAADVHMTATGFLEDYSPQDPGCLVLDVRLPDMDGIELLRECRRRGWSAPAIILTAYGNVSSAVAGMKLGALDYVEKPFDAPSLVSKVKAAIALDIDQRRAAAEQAASRQRFACLSERERELVGLLIAGMSSKEIASILDLAVKTVDNHRAHIMVKAGAVNAADLVRLAVMAGFKPDLRRVEPLPCPPGHLRAYRN